MSVRLRDLITGVAIVAVMGLLSARSRAQSPVTLTPNLLQELQWRSIGPFRGGRATAVAGQPTQPNVIYLGTPGGGLWKTVDYGRTWQPLFDRESTGTIGAVAVAPSDANIIYAGTGDATFRVRPTAGDGLFKSSDGGRTWARLGLADSGAIANILVDPRDANRLFVAVPGDPSGPSQARGVFRSINGGRTFERVLLRDENTGAVALRFDPRDPAVVYAVCWQARWMDDDTAQNGPGSGLFKSVDGGTTWRQIGRGLPTFAESGLGRIAIAAAPTNPERLFALAGTRDGGGIYRSDDRGDTWSRMSRAPGSDGPDTAGAAQIEVDPQNADVLYVAGRAAWKSADGGRTFAPLAVSGGPFDDLWINPSHPDVVVLAGDQGGRITVNGGQTWNDADQPTSRFDRLAFDAAFPFRVCGTSAETLVCASSHGDAVAQPGIDLGEAGDLAPDPSDAEVVYAGSVVRYDQRTGQVQDVSPPRDESDRVSHAAPIEFAPMDPRTLYFASSVVWKTVNAGQSWIRMSPDLSIGPEPTSGSGSAEPPSVPGGAHRGAISALALSTIDSRVIWAGSDNGRIHVTRDGGTTWADVTPANAPVSHVVSIESSHFDTNSAYAVIHPPDNAHPLVRRTRDGGQTWSDIVTGLPSSGDVNVIREDPIRRGLLFAATDRSVFFSFDDGNTWQSLRLNLPPVPVESLAIRDTDLAIATDGRGFWILDDVMPLRQITDDVLRTDGFIFRPPTAWRARAAQSDPSTNTGAGSGVPLTYLLGPSVKGPVTVDIIDTLSGELLRQFSSDAPAADDVARVGVDAKAPQLSIAAGLHRFMWDLRYAPPPAFPPAGALTMAPASGGLLGRWVSPGTYQVRFTVDGRVFRQAVAVKMDPRVRASAADLALQAKLSKSADDLLRQLWTTRVDLVRQSSGSSSSVAAAPARALAELDAAAGALTRAFTTLQTADARPTAAVEAATTAALARATAAIEAAR